MGIGVLGDLHSVDPNTRGCVQVVVLISDCHVQREIVLLFDRVGRRGRQVGIDISLKDARRVASMAARNLAGPYRRMLDVVNNRHGDRARVSRPG